jgi:hypothetical protein
VLREAASKALQQAAAGALKGNRQGHASGQMMTPGKKFLPVAELGLVAANLRNGRIAHGTNPLSTKRLRTYLRCKFAVRTRIKKHRPLQKQTGDVSVLFRLVGR